MRIALNKIQQTEKAFKRIIQPLKAYLNLSFGYMIVLKDGRYYKLMEDTRCLEKFVTEIKKSSIFCARNVTNHLDLGYNFTIWPNFPTNSAMEIYHQYQIWNGITVSRVERQYTELYFFTKAECQVDWHKFYIRNKVALIKFIEYFDQHKELLMLKGRDLYCGMFKFEEGFDNQIPESEYLSKDAGIISFVNSLQIEENLNLHTTNICIGNNKNREKASYIDNVTMLYKLTEKDKEIIVRISYGETAKTIAKMTGISPRTVEYHIEKIKVKTGLRTKSEIIAFYHSHHNKD